jgi:hypothetical protein
MEKELATTLCRQHLGSLNVEVDGTHSYHSVKSVRRIFYKADRHCGQEIIRLLWNPKIHYCVQTSPVLIRMNPVNTFTPYFFLKLICRLNSGNAFYHSVQNLSSHLTSTILKIEIHKNIISFLVLYSFETWSLTLTEEQNIGWECFGTEGWGEYLDLEEGSGGRFKKIAQWGTS